MGETNPLIELQQNVNKLFQTEDVDTTEPLIELQQNVNENVEKAWVAGKRPLIELQQNVNQKRGVVNENNKGAFNRTIVECKYS